MGRESVSVCARSSGPILEGGGGGGHAERPQATAADPGAKPPVAGEALGGKGVSDPPPRSQGLACDFGRTERGRDPERLKIRRR